MGKTTKIVIAAASIFVVLAGVVAYLVYFDPLGLFGSDLPKYAPEGTDQIEYINYKKWSKTKIFAAYKKTLSYEEVIEGLRGSGIDVEKLYDSEVCKFRNRNAEMSGKGFVETEVCRGSQVGAEFKWRLDLAKKNADRLQKRAEEEKKRAEEEKREPEKREVPKFSADKIGGKEAFVYSYGDEKEVAILLDKDLVQYSEKDDREASPVSVPLKKESTAVTRAIDTKALYSYAWEVKIPEKYRAELNDTEKGVAIGLKMVRINVYESGSSDIEVKAEFIYENDDQAKTAKKFAEELRKKYMAKKHFRFCPFIDGRSGAEILAAAEISCSGKKIVAKAKYSQNTIARRIEELDNERREGKKRSASEK